MGLSHRVPASQVVVTAVNPGMAWTSMTQSLSPEVVPAWRHIMPVVRFFQRRADPVNAARNCERLVIAGPGTIEGRYFDGAKPKNLPPKFADPGLPDRVQAIGTELRAAAATARDRK
jgi:hypothetical protein